MGTMCRLVVLSLLAVMPSATVYAQAYPNKVVKIVVPFPPGGGGDTVMRLFADKLTTSLGQSVIVENRAGAAGRVGTEYVAHSPPDGYTLLQGSPATLIIPPALFPKLPYRSPDDFSPVTLLAYDSQVLVINPAVQARSIPELIALAKSQPNKLNFASSGPGDLNHLSAELLQMQAGVKMLHVPYKGAAPALLSVVSGETSLMFANVIPALPQIKANKLIPLGVASLKRSPILPDVPTIAESGLPGFEAVTFYAILAAAGTPRDVTQRLNQEFAKAAQLPDLKSRLASYGLDVVASSPEELGTVISTEISKWSKVIKEADIKVAE